MIKNSSHNTISLPETGWISNENGELEIEYFHGTAYPERITNMVDQNESDNEEEFEFSSDDDEEENDGNWSDDDWNPNK